MHHAQRLAVAALLSLPALASGPLPAGAAEQNASVTISDSGYSPGSVTIVVGGSVSWTNGGSNIHTATSVGGAPLPFDTGGLAPSQSTSFTFSAPGTYPYNSATDCLNGHSSPSFNCGGATVTVVPAGAQAATAPAPAAPAAAAPVAAAPAAPAGAPQQNATVTITDKGVEPGTVTVALGGSVTWINNSGSLVHTATTTGGGNPTPFDTGGLGPGQTGSLTFAQPGTYTYTSATDCIGNSTPGFNCGPYTVVVGSTAASLAPVPGPAAAAAPVVSNTTVSISDSSGFTPSTLTIRAGQTVTWVNNGSQVHNVSSNPGYFNAFDSGGLGPGQKYSYNFTIPGTYGYHSSTEPVYSTDAVSGNIITSYQFNGTIVVQ